MLNFYQLTASPFLCVISVYALHPIVRISCFPNTISFSSFCSWSFPTDHRYKLQAVRQKPSSLHPKDCRSAKSHPRSAYCVLMLSELPVNVSFLQTGKSVAGFPPVFPFPRSASLSGTGMPPRRNDKVPPLRHAG